MCKQPEIADSLTIRLVHNAMEEAEVNPAFRGLLEIEDYPRTLPYRQKVILMTQRTDGVEIFLYCLFLQVSPRGMPIITPIIES